MDCSQRTIQGVLHKFERLLLNIRKDASSKSLGRQSTSFLDLAHRESVDTEDA